MPKCTICEKETRSVLPSDNGWVCWQCHDSGKDGKAKRACSHEEDDIQKEFFKTVRVVFPTIPDKLLFAVPNGGKRNKLEGARLKMQGVKSGVADVLLLIPRGGYNCLCMEFKTSTGTQSPEQKEFQQQIVEAGGKYVIVRSAAAAIEEMKIYLK